MNIFWGGVPQNRADKQGNNKGLGHRMAPLEKKKKKKGAKTPRGCQTGTITAATKKFPLDPRGNKKRKDLGCSPLKNR